MDVVEAMQNGGNSFSRSRVEEDGQNLGTPARYSCCMQFIVSLPRNVHAKVAIGQFDDVDSPRDKLQETHPTSTAPSCRQLGIGVNTTSFPIDQIITSGGQRF
jgi:hypothetical protein